MAIGIRITFHGLTQEQFDAGHDQINPDRVAPDGLLFHASGPIEGGWGVTDFWESRAHFEAFSAQIPAGMEAAGVALSQPPQVEEFAVHEIVRP